MIRHLGTSFVNKSATNKPSIQKIRDWFDKLSDTEKQNIYEMMNKRIKPSDDPREDLAKRYLDSDIYD